MMQDVRFVVPGKPVGKTVIRARGNQYFVAPKTRAEMDAVRTIAGFAMGGRGPMAGPVELRLCAWVPIPQSWSQRKRALAREGALLPVVKPDWDNIGKMCDALKHVVWNDDAQVTDVHLWKRYSDDPRVVVEIRQIEPGGVGQ